MHEVNIKYKFLSKKKYFYKDYCITPLRKMDIQKIRKWRNENISVLRQKNKLSSKEQESYYNTVIKKTFTKKKPPQILFSFLKNSECIGYGGFVHIDWNKKISEVSFLVDTYRYKNKKIYCDDFNSFYTIIKKIAFSDIGFKILTTETYDIRPYHIKLLEKNNFKLKNILKNHIIISDLKVDSLFHECFNPLLKN